MALIEHRGLAAAREVPRSGGAFERLVPDRRPSSSQLSLADGQAKNNWSHLVAAVDAGIAVAISATRDGGAISVTIWKGDKRYREYCTSAGELDVVFEALGALAVG